MSQDNHHSPQLDSLALRETVNTVLNVCGFGSILQVGAADAAIMRALLTEGVDIRGVSNSAPTTEQDSQTLPGRIEQAAYTTLPYQDGAFLSLLCFNILEDLSEEDLIAVITELRRVTRKFLIVKVFRNPEGPGATRGRRWWEERFFDAGFRKHPAYHAVLGYEDLETETQEVLIPLEKIAEEAVVKYPLSPGLDHHEDASRESGRRSDARMYRYHWASQFVRCGDAVIITSCGHGYGAHMIASRTLAESVVGFDGNASAIEYAAANFAQSSNRLSFRESHSAELSIVPDHTIDTIISFESAEYFRDAPSFLKECSRILAPGGRLIMSVPNDRSDDNRASWDTFIRHLGSLFDLEVTASQSAGEGSNGRRILSIADPASAPGSEWGLAVAVRSPLGAKEIPFRERFYPYSHPPQNALAFERDYINPWIVRSLVEYPTRITNPTLLTETADKLRDESPASSPDYGAAVCIQGYRIIEDGNAGLSSFESLLDEIHTYCSKPVETSHQLRWQISLRFLECEVLKRLGRLEEALAAFENLSRMNCREFSPTLMTKTVGAAFNAGLLAVSLRDTVRAATNFRSCIALTQELFQCAPSELYGKPEWPLSFALTVLTEVTDKAFQASVALDLLNRNDPRIEPLLHQRLGASWQRLIRDRFHVIQKLDRMLRDRPNDPDLANVEKLAADRFETIQAMDGMIRERDIALHATERLADEQNATIQKMDGMIGERDRTIEAMEKLIKERTLTIEATEKLARDRYAAIQEMGSLLGERDTRLADASQSMNEQSKVIQELKEQLSVQSAEIKELRALLAGPLWKRLRPGVK